MSEVRWSTTLTTAPSAPADPLLDPVPAVTLADRLGRTQLGDEWRQVLTQYDNAARAVRAAQRRQIALGWNVPANTIDERGQQALDHDERGQAFHHGERGQALDDDDLSL